jgi:hypothetical protein
MLVLLLFALLIRMPAALLQPLRKPGRLWLLLLVLFLLPLPVLLHLLPLHGLKALLLLDHLVELACDCRVGFAAANPSARGLHCKG